MSRAHFGSPINVFEIVQHIVLKCVDRSVHDRRGPDADDKRVTIRDCASNPTSADAATGSGHVLDDTGWPSEVLMRSATMRKRIDGSARCERYDHRD